MDNFCINESLLHESDSSLPSAAVLEVIEPLQKPSKVCVPFLKLSTTNKIVIVFVAGIRYTYSIIT